MADLRATFEGYHYQDLVTATFLVKSLLGTVNEVIADRKLFAGDLFDDLTVQEAGVKTRRQIKYSTRETTEFASQFILTQCKHIALDNLIRSIERGEANWQHRICATWRSPSDSQTRNILIQVDEIGTFPGISTKCYKLNADALWPNGSLPEWRSLHQARDLDRDIFVNAVGQLVLELDCPPISHSLRNPGRLEQVLLDMLRNDVGIGRYPNQHLNEVDSAAHLIYLASRAKGRECVEIDSLAADLGLRTDFGRVAQQFPIRRDEEVSRSSTLERLVEAIQQEERLLLVGEPGAGKSWLLTQLVDRLLNAGYIVARHYCFLEIGDELAPRRVLAETLFGNLTATVIDACPRLRESKRPLYSAGPSEFQQLVQRAADDTGTAGIVVIVDGLDHISRVRGLHCGIAEADTRIVDELASLDLPDRAHLVLGSQPGTHLEPLRHTLYESEVPPWSQSEVEDLAGRLGLWRVLDDLGLGDAREMLSAALSSKAAGNPLYARYVIREVVDALQERHAVTPVDVVRGLPAYDPGLVRYYEYLLGGADHAAERLAEILACIDFGVLRSEIEEISGSVFGPLVQGAIQRLRPVLTQALAQRGIRIYHESFRRFLLDRLSTRSNGFRDTLNPVIEWLEDREFFDDSLAFRFFLPSLQRAERHDKILEVLSDDFAIKCVAGAHAGEAAFGNLRIIVWTAVRVRDYVALARAAEVRRALFAAYDDHLTEQVEAYGTTYAAIFGAQALSERLTFDGRPTFPRDRGLLFCSLCDKSGVVPPWREYLRLEKGSHSESELGSLEVAAFRGHLKTRDFAGLFDAIGQYLRGLDDASHPYPRGIIEESVSVAGVDGCQPLVQDSLLKPQVAARLHLTIAVHHLADGNNEAASASANRAAELAEDPVVLAESLVAGADVETIRRRLQTGGVFALQPPPTGTYKEHVGELARWVAIASLHGNAPDSGVSVLRDGIRGSGWFRGWLRFVIDLSLAESARFSSVRQAAEDTLEALRELATYDKPFEGETRTCDLHYLHGVIRDTFKRALSLLGDGALWQAGVQLLRKIGQQTSTHFDGARVATGPIDDDALGKILLKYLSDPVQSAFAVEWLRSIARDSESNAEYYSDHANHQMRLATALAETGDGNAALEEWRCAARSLCAYTYRKDITVWETLGHASDIARALPEKAEEVFSRSQRLTDAVLYHTDGRETKHAPNSWFEELANWEPERAAVLLALAMTKDGGSWDWRNEEALTTLANTVGTKIDPLLTFLLDCAMVIGLTRRGESDHSACLKRLLEAYPEFGQTALRLGSARLSDDPASPMEEDRARLHKLAAKLGLRLSTPGERDHAVKDEALSEAKPLRHSVGSNKPTECWFSPNATPIQLMSGIRRTRSSSPGLDSKSLLNALGYRLESLLAIGNEADVRRLLTFFAEERRYDKSGDLLVALGAGLQRSGHNSAAATAYALAYIYLGVEWYGDPTREQDEALRTAIQLDPDQVERVLLEQVGIALEGNWPVGGVPRRLAGFALHRGNPAQAFDIWHAATQVIELRLWDPKAPPGVFPRCDEHSLPSLELEASAVAVLLARISHPDLLRKLAALSGLSILIDVGHSALISALRHHLLVNSSVTQLTAVLNALWDFERAPYPHTQALAPELQCYARSDCFIVARLSAALLSRAGASVPQSLVSFDSQGLPSVDTRKRRAILSLDQSNRFRQMAELLPELPDFAAREFERIFESAGAHRDRHNSRWTATTDRAHPERPPGPFLTWKGELFEIAFQRALQLLPCQLMKRGEWHAVAEAEVLGHLRLNVRTHVRYWLSRSERPPLPSPSEREPGRGDLERCGIGDELEGWYRLALYEQQVLLREYGSSEPSQEITVHCGSVFTPANAAPPSESLPFAAGVWSEMWYGLQQSEVLLRCLRGPVVSLDFTDTFLGEYALLSLPESVTARLGLTVRDCLDRLALLDSDGEVRVVFRCWWQLGADDYRGDAYPSLVGCELLAHPSIVDRLSSASAHPLAVWTVVQRQSLGEDSTGAN